jgi:hypothetical protein
MKLFTSWLRAPAPNSFILCLAAALSVGCTGSYGSLNTTSRLVVTIVSSGNLGAKDKPFPLSFDPSPPIALKIVAMRADGQIDPTYNGYVRLSVKPGSVVGVTGDANRVDGRNVLLQSGVVENVSVSIAASFGPTHIWAEDVGYTPADPLRKPPPQCANGIDDNGNGVVDYPAEPGCFAANDDNEDLGTYAAGASGTVWFVSPRIADVRGVTQGGAGTSFPHQAVQVDTGWRSDTLKFDFSTIVTRIASDGFYVTDIDDKRGFSSVFAYNFSSPPRMRVCDRLRSLGGTASDFFGFTEIGFPTWELEEWVPLVKDEHGVPLPADQQPPGARECLIPEPHGFPVPDIERDETTGNFVSTASLLANIAALVRVESHPDPDPNKVVDLHVSKHFGPAFPQPPGYGPTDDATNCDLNKDGKVDFNTDPEKTCAANCTKDVECTEYSNFLSRSAFILTMITKDPVTHFPVSGSIQADSSTAAEIDPVALRGQPIRSFTGTLRYFSGGTQFTIEARCSDDIVTDLNSSPVGSDHACVHPRTDSENNSASN